MINEFNLEDDVLTIKPIVRRNTVRAVIIKDDLLLMAYSKKFNDYMFPGGGVDAGETNEGALLRELKEELGVNSVSKMSLMLIVNELRDYTNLNNLNQVSHYYLVETTDFGQPNLEAYEMSFGLEPTWVSLQDAIKANQKEISRRQVEGVTGVHPYATLKRANTVLNFLKEQKERIDDFYEKR